MPFLKKIDNIIFKSSSGAHQGDRSLLIISFVLLAFGLVVLFSASGAVSYLKYHDSYYLITHQLFGVALGAVAFYFFSAINYSFWRKIAFLMLILSIFLLALVFLPWLKADWGTARSWIKIFGFSLQPSEFVKLFFLFYLAAWIVKRKEIIRDFKESTLPFLIILGSIVALMLLQPDLGTLSIIMASAFIVYYVGGGKLRHLLLIALCGIIGLFFMLQLKPYQQDRFRCVVDPSYDTKKSCYQVNQALIAVGSGGLWGRGLGASRQKYLYLPEVTGDSIFAVIAEELGFVISLALIALYLALFYRGWKISNSSPDDFGRLLSIGISSWLFIQAMVNIGGIINLIPMTGVPVPVISYGGTCLIANMAAIGVLFNISKIAKK